jgi:hypothetical protein
MNQILLSLRANLENLGVSQILKCKIDHYYNRRIFSDILAKPRLIQVSKFPQHVIQRPTKSNIKFKCVASGNPKPTITWFHNNEQLTDSESKKGRFSLVIHNLVVEDSGNYTCLASNPFGSIAHSYILQVIGKNQKLQNHYQNYCKIFSLFL